jgi:hypothetical protein
MSSVLECLSLHIERLEDYGMDFNGLRSKYFDKICRKIPKAVKIEPIGYLA